MAGNGKDTRSDRDSQSLVADLLRRATSPEVLAGVAGAAAAARFTKHMVEESDETDADERGELEEIDDAQSSGEDDADSGDDEVDEDDPRQTRAEEDEPGEDEREGPEGAVESDDDEDEDAEEQADPRQDDDAEERADERDSSAASNGSAATDDERMELLDHARRYGEQLTGHPVESFSSLEKDDRGWRIGIEVVELSRVPSTTDVLGSYELVLGDDGDFVDFRRGHRYNRNSTDDGS